MGLRTLWDSGLCGAGPYGTAPHGTHDPMELRTQWIQDTMEFRALWDRILWTQDPIGQEPMGKDPMGLLTQWDTGPCVAGHYGAG